MKKNLPLEKKMRTKQFYGSKIDDSRLFMSRPQNIRTIRYSFHKSEFSSSFQTQKIPWPRKIQFEQFKTPNYDFRFT